MIEQGSDEWFAMKLGKVSASRIADVVAKGKGNAPSATRANYAAQLMLERVTGQKQETYINAAMNWGVEQEPLARLAYSLHKGVEVEEVSFIDHPFILRSGASPDGLVGTDGMLEIKCPNTATHIKWALAGEVPPEHALQLHWQMACTGRQWNDFVSFDPRMPEGQQLFIRRLLRDNDLIDKLESEVVFFDGSVEAMIIECNGIKWF
jgi:putative phage-type endonuclease